MVLHWRCGDTSAFSNSQNGKLPFPHSVLRLWKIQIQVLEHNESPLFLLFNANCGEKLKELPISIYESETKVVNDVPTMVRPSTIVIHNQ